MKALFIVPLILGTVFDSVFLWAMGMDIAHNTYQMIGIWCGIGLVLVVGIFGVLIIALE
jgi:hypothetical protein